MGAALLGPEVRYEKTGDFSIELSALRGIACMVVLIFHCLIMFPADGWGYHQVMELGLLTGHTWRQWLLKILFAAFNGTAAVIFFFVLSGTVMGMSIERDSILAALKNFYVRRLLRIAPSMWLSVFVGFAFVWIVQPFAVFPNAATGVNEWYKSPATPENLILGLLSYKSYFNPVNWSLYIEFIGSFFFPIFVWMMRYRNTAVVLWICLAVVYAHQPETYANSNVYLLDFAIGLSILQWGSALARWLDARHRMIRLSIMVACYLLIGLSKPGFHHYPVAVMNFCEAAGSAGIIAYVLFSSRRLPFLQKGFWTFIGKISYSLYLCHFILLYVPAYFIASHVDPAVTLKYGLLINLCIVAVCIPAAIGVATFLYRYVEAPAVRLSKRISNSDRQVAPQAA